MDEKLTMADGTEIPDAHVLTSDGALWFYVQNGMTLAEVFAVMNNPEKTGTITAFRYQAEQTYTGFTDLQSIRKDDEQVSGSLKRRV